MEALTMLDRLPSKFIVEELLRVRGHAAVLEILQVTPNRLKAFESGRGCLKDEQLARITEITGRSWMRWGVDPIARGSRTSQQKKLDAATFELLDTIDPIQSPVSKSGARAKPSRLRGSKIAV
jgi:hypothetical protein